MTLVLNRFILTLQNYYFLTRKNFDLLCILMIFLVCVSVCECEYICAILLNSREKLNKVGDNKIHGKQLKFCLCLV